MKFKDFVKEGIGFAIGMTIAMTIVNIISTAIGNEIKKINELSKETEPTDKTEEAE